MMMKNKTYVDECASSLGEHELSGGEWWCSELAFFHNKNIALNSSTVQFDGEIAP